MQDAKERYSEFAEEAANRKRMLLSGERIHACRVVLKNLLRPTLPEEHKQLFLERLRTSTIGLTNLIADLSAVIHALMLESARRDFIITDDGQIISLRPEQDQPLNIDQLLPSTAQRDKVYLVDDKCIQVAPLPKICHLFKVRMPLQTYSVATIYSHCIQNTYPPPPAKGP